MLFEVAVSELSAAAARSWLSPVAAGAAEPAAVVCVAASPYPGAALDPSAASDAAGAGPGAAPRANARMIDSGSQFAAGWRAPTWASRPSAVGR
jgi:hypothetical protein